MNTDAAKIADIIKDYQGSNNIVIDENHVLTWVNQFEENDRDFLLSELTHILSQAYYSKERVVKCMFDCVDFLRKELKYKDAISFLANTIYISTQGAEKSQTELLDLFYQEIEKKYGLKRRHIGSKSKTNVIYFDDILATGKTLFREVSNWLDNDSNHTPSKKYYDLLTENRFKFIVSTMCSHQWGKNNVDYQIKKSFGETIRKKILYCSEFSVENNPTSYKPSLNLVYPVDEGLQTVSNYFDTIDTGNYQLNANFAYRKVNSPEKETFFTNSENRRRYESIVLLKGIELLQQVRNLNNKSLRPLGFTVRSHKTFGIGTQFFTYRNVSNTTPLVFWWETNGWYPLFPVKNRGN